MIKSQRKTKLKRRLIYCFLIVFVGANTIAYFHAYKFTHFDLDADAKTEKPGDLSFGQKIKTLVFGINNPKPVNSRTPETEYQTIYLSGNTQIECWEICADSSKGTVILFHGFSGEKSSMLGKADVFLELNYNVLLVDFMGCGGSEGIQTTIGFKEAHDVKASVDYISEKGEQNIILLGTSMGAVAIMKAINNYDLPISGVILECPFGTMLQTVKSRFSDLGVPSFPMAQLLMFWGGVQNGFNAFKHNPAYYANNIECPTLLLYGEKDIKVSRQEINDIFSNLQGDKYLKTFPEAGHNNYLIKYYDEWRQDVEEFLVLNKG